MKHKTAREAAMRWRDDAFPAPERLAGRVIAVLAFFLFLLTATMHAQLTTGNLSGTVADQSGAVVPNARVTLTNEASHDTRISTSNSAGYFSFAAVQPGSYTVTIDANGFNTWKQSGIPMNPGDIREVSGIKLTTGGGTTTVEVQAAAAQILPTDSGERAAILSSKDIEKLALEGRNVSELLKVLPGVSMTAGGTGGGTSMDFSASAPTGSTVGNGLTTSGAPYRGGTAYMLDGANIIDPGCNCYSIAVPNPDMTQEVKVQGSFGADSSNGPEIVNVISKSGGAQYHGEGYFYARNQVLNANTWLNNNSGIKRPNGEYYYPGGNLGGPVKIPGTSFNANNKLLFWVGYEYYKQTLPAAQPFESYIPSAGMMAGDFTPSGDGNAALCPNGFSSSANNWCNNLSGAVAPDGTPITGGVIPAKYLDAGAAALMKMFPKPNANPATTPGGFNYIQPITNEQNGYVFRARVDYNLNDNTKFFATYQQGNTTFITPGHVWWTPSYTIPYPGGNITSPNTSRVVTANLVNIITPTLTNEFVFGWGWDDGPFNPSKLSAIYKSALGYPYATVYNAASLVAPSINSPGAQTFPDISQPAFFGTSGSYPLVKAIPSFADNVTKVWRSHTFKFGAFTELVGNRQGVWSYPNGSLSFGSSPESNNVAGSQVASGTKIGSSNPTANLVMGIASGFSQNNYVPVQDMAYRTTAGYIMDNWHVNSRLNLNLGVRLDHIGRWYDRQGTGLAVWLPQLYQQDVAANQTAGSMVVEYPGIRWHAIDKSIRNAGSPVDWAYIEPRFGFAYDFSGNGNTVIRGGWGEYRWNDEPASASALSTAQNMQSYNSPGGQAITLSQIALQTPSGNAMPAGSVTAMDYNDHRMPLTYSWNLTWDQQLPGKTMLEMAYVGNSSNYLLMGGQSDGSGIGGSEFSNLNKIPVGGLFQPDPVKGTSAPADPDNTGSYTLADYLPYSGCTASGNCYGYGTNSLTVHEHTGYSNYHGLQVAWLKQTGRLSFDFNYTWSKSLGIINSTLDAFNVHGNYGILAIDRPQVFNASYAYDLGSLYHGDFLLWKGVANGWTISGINTFQSGSNLQSNSSQNLGLTIYGKDANGNTEQLTSKTWFGTDANSILPVATCDPRSNLRSHQLLNLSCFSAPQIGQQGVRQFHPYFNGPWYTDSDLSVYKTFAITERQHVQFRASAFNFMNHPLWGFSGNNLLTLKYNTPDRGHTFTTDASTLGLASTSLWGVMNQKAAYSGAGYNRIVELSLKYTF